MLKTEPAHLMFPTKLKKAKYIQNWNSPRIDISAFTPEEISVGISNIAFASWRHSCLCFYQLLTLKLLHSQVMSNKFLKNMWPLCMLCPFLLKCLLLLHNLRIRVSILGCCSLVLWKAGHFCLKKVKSFFLTLKIFEKQNLYAAKPCQTKNIFDFSNRVSDFSYLSDIFNC